MTQLINQINRHKKSLENVRIRLTNDENECLLVRFTSLNWTENKNLALKMSQPQRDHVVRTMVSIVKSNCGKNSISP